jgi:hypothetical protein
MKNAIIEVSTEVKALVESCAKEICDKVEAKHEQFNQDLNAWTGFLVLKRLGVEVPEEIRPKVRQALKKLGNSSALRQAITAKKEKEIAAEEIVDALKDLA